MPNNKLTDRLIAILTLQLNKDYQALRSNYSNETVYKELYARLWHGLYANDELLQSPLYALAEPDKRKVIQILDIVYGMHNHENTPLRLENPMQHQFVTHIHTSYGCHHNDLFHDYLLINACQNNHYNHHRHKSNIAPNRLDNKDDTTSVLAMLAVLALSIAAFAALIYVIESILSAGERFYFNEGWLHASFSMMSGILGATIFSMLCAGPALLLAVSAGLSNPVGWAAITLGIIGFAGGALLTQLGQYVLTPLLHQDAIEPKDPHRFSLTHQQQVHLENKGIDPLKVKCAIVLLHMQMSQPSLPSFLGRHLGFSNHNQAIITKIRRLRFGDCGESIKINNTLTLNLKLERTQSLRFGQVRPSAPDEQTTSDAPPPSYAAATGTEKKS